MRLTFDRMSTFAMMLAFGIQHGCVPMRKTRVEQPEPSQIEGAAAGKQLDELHKIIFRANEKYKEVEDYRCVFLKRQRIGDELQTTQRILLKFKKPMSVYMKWLNEPHKGQEVLYVPGRYGEKGFARAGGWKGKLMPVIRIDVDGYWVMRDNLRTLDKVGIGPFLDIFMENFRRADKADEGALIDRGEGKVGGRPVRVIESVLPPEESKGYYCYRCVIHYDKENGLPLEIEIYDWDNKLREEYQYTDLELNVGLKEKDFDRENPEYNF
jgi:hypothetical protein